MTEVRLCSEPGCVGKHYAKGFCRNCYVNKDSRNKETRARWRDSNRADIRSKNKEWKAKNVDRVREAERSRYKNSPELRAKNLERSRSPRYVAWRKANKRKIRSFFDEDTFDKCLEFQDGKCAVCRVTFTEEQPTKMCCDHCHATKQPRGLLCFMCNVSLGIYEKYQRGRGLTFPDYDSYLESPPVSQARGEK